ncbi:ribbon-helix-helix domain-containing protein [uncultured Martelella sp.]|uniref:ribbon-helix-helix domain-containing protein n=1 Tax=uncultured Martelella sp. TaxID=392331 RepID=UPI0029C6FB69|nr:ribbon-helix-helix domain-containing protein [uncultured Martelella sp.]
MCRLFIAADPALWESTTRSIRIDGMVTSIRLENFFWTVLAEIGGRDGLATTQLITKLYHEANEAGHDSGNFTSFLRVCCGRYLALQLSGELPDGLPIGKIDAGGILERENLRRKAVA